MTSPEKKKKILVFGNPLTKKDNIALKILPSLRKKFPEIEFMEFDPTEGIENEGANLTIIDAVEGAKEVIVLTEKDFGKIESGKIFSVHDFDLGQTLKLLKKAKILEKATIFGIPQKMEKNRAFAEISKKIIEHIN